MKQYSLLVNFIKTPTFKIIDFLVENKGLDFTKTDIENGADISRASLFNYWEQLEKNGLVRETRRFGKTRVYTLNGESPVIKKILELEATLIKQSMMKAASKKKEILVNN